MPASLTTTTCHLQGLAPFLTTILLLRGTLCAPPPLGVAITNQCPLDTLNYLKVFYARALTEQSNLEFP
ncbi:hypothetical protein NQ318_003430 [Aromia moschata]|uniref:Uncharacterized protein n=1 Tax=Aromia moschata TaxID=1265417 RepID=A0AAV8YUK8_9CUCU|nr:hypothetical protein NQ318_003430 [Aromia moschata]